jgi:PPOX class probable F420-dependent enzyme
MEVADGLQLARATRESVLVTMRGNGRPQLSNVWHGVDDAGVISVSITADRAKYGNLRRDPWAAVHVTRPDFIAYVILECDVSLSPIVAAIDDATVDELIAHYRRVVGEHASWDEFRRTQVEQRRVLARLTPNRTYGMLPTPPA